MKTFIKGLLRESLLTEEKIDDFFVFLAKDPHRKSQATVFYTNPVKVNKFIKDEAGNKVPNPMDGKLYKSQRISFKWEHTYKDAMAKINPDHVMKQRSGTYEKVQGFNVLEMGKSGLYLPVVPTGSDSVYGVMGEDGKLQVIPKEEAYKYMPPAREVNASAPPVRQLIVDRIFMIKAGGNVWKNPHFIYEYVGPQNELDYKD